MCEIEIPLLEGRKIWSKKKKKKKRESYDCLSVSFWFWYDGAYVQSSKLQFIHALQLNDINQEVAYC